MNKKHVTQLYNRILFRNKKKRSTDTSNINESWNHYSKLKEPTGDRIILSLIAEMQHAFFIFVKDITDFSFILSPGPLH